MSAGRITTAPFRIGQRVAVTWLVKKRGEAPTRVYFPGSVVSVGPKTVRVKTDSYPVARNLVATSLIQWNDTRDTE